MRSFARRPVPLLAAVPFLALLGLTSCSSTTSPTTTSKAALTLTVVPNPITATNSLNPAIFDYDITYKVTITETAGVGGMINSVIGTIYDPLTGAFVIDTIYDTNDLIALAGGAHLAANGAITVGQQLSYRLAERGRQALLGVQVQMVDDNHNLINQGAIVQVQ